MAELNLAKAIEAQKAFIAIPEQMIGTGLNQPFCNANSGSRKLMFATHSNHRLPILEPEIALVQTGFENEFGFHSSSYIKANADYEVVAKIAKFSFNPDHHYFLILKNLDTGMHELFERVSFEHITESYGYLINNEYIDSLKVGTHIPKETVMQKSMAYDEFDNHRQGKNLITANISCNHTMEDAIIMAKSVAESFKTPLIRKVNININDNDILLNMYGDGFNYKVIPDIGEEITDGILCAVRREKKEESLFAQSWEHLKDIMMSDDKYTTQGRIVDIDVYCNNREGLKESAYATQIHKYFSESLRVCSELVTMIDHIREVECGIKMSYDLEKMYINSKRILNGDSFIKERPFSYLDIDIYVLEENAVSIGDKFADRYGGKGVVSQILPDEEMPRLDNGEIVQIIFNKATCVNRLNPGQLIEQSLNHITSRIIDYINMNILQPEECLEMFLTFLKIVNPDQYVYYKSFTDTLTDDCQIMDFVGTFINDHGIIMSLMPLSSNVDIDKLAELYEAFPFATMRYMDCPIEDSAGNIRFVKSRRPVTAGRKYIYRLKQYAEEKFSVTSLSATNIRNENSRSKSNKEYRGLFTKTPIRFGEMEAGDLSHLGMEYVVISLLIYSSSPHGRRLAEQLITGDPFNIDIRLDANAKSRNVEILNAILKTMGLRLKFIKTKAKKIKPIVMAPVRKNTVENKIVKPIIELKELTDEQAEDLKELIQKNLEAGQEAGIVRPIAIQPIRKGRMK